jgi:hypothetical protein
MPVFQLTKLVALFCALLLAGCGYDATGGERTPANADEMRRELLLSDEPAEAIGVLDAQETLAADSEATVVGVIGGVPNPFGSGDASFVIADAAVLAEDDGHDCEKEGCHFCKKNNQEPSHGLALVCFVDEQGQPRRFDARETFGLQAEQTVVVRGRCQKDASGMLVLTATGIYVRR